MRSRFAALLLSLVAACSYFQDPAQEEATIVAPGHFLAGSGVIDAVGVLPNANSGNTKRSSTGRAPDPNLYRLSLRMDAGGFQQVDVDNGTFMAGAAGWLAHNRRVGRGCGPAPHRAARVGGGCGGRGRRAPELAPPGGARRRAT